METAGVALRWLQLACGLGLLGGALLRLMAAPAATPLTAGWRRTVGAMAGWQAAGLVLAGLGLLLLQTASVTGRPLPALQAADVARLLDSTRYGQVWLARQALALGLLLVLVGAPQLRTTRRLGERAGAALLLAAAALHTAAAAFTGHGAATEPVWLAGSGHALHLLAAGAWAGALPALTLGLWRSARSADAADRRAFGALLHRFSGVATASVLLLVASGAVIGHLQLGAPRQWPGGIDDLLPAIATLLERVAVPLLATPYGLLVLSKIALLVPVLLIAARVRFVWLPRLGRAEHGAAAPMQATARCVATEAAVVLLILLAAAAVSGTLPAAHDRAVWPMPFRVSVAATWAQPGVPTQVLGGLLLAGIGAVLGAIAGQGWFAGRRTAATRGLAGLAALASVCGAALATQALSVPAYPDTFRRSDSPYTAQSVASGAALYRQHCAECHGAGGRGDGPGLAGKASPAANLTEPHTALHTGGDLFWWLTHGKPGTEMPGFADGLSAEARWDLVNFLRAFSAGFQARILTPGVVSGRPWLATPDVDYTTVAGASGALKDFREHRAVLLVFYSWPASQARLLQLARALPALHARQAEVLAVPLPGTGVAPPDGWPFSTVADGADDAATAYLLFRRTRADAGRGVLDDPPAHLEFLIDRFGYTRARWLPHEAADAQRGDWSDLGALGTQIDRLNREGRLLPPPDDHVH